MTLVQQQQYSLGMAHQLEHSDSVLISTHEPDQCSGEHCTIHNMSDHSLRHLRQVWSGQYMERHTDDGQVWVDPDDPKQQERPNAARCLVCGDLLYSRHHYDFKTCCCGRLSVDGGPDYIRRVWSDIAGVEETTEWPVPAGWK